MKKSFTLIELIIVVGIISMVTAITMLSYGKVSSWYDLYGQRKTLVADLRQTQENALTTQTRYKLKFIAGNPTSYQLIKINPDLSENTIWTKKMSTNIIFQTNLTNSEVIFSSDGSAASGGEIDLKIQASSNWKKIIISPIGNTKEQ